MGEVIFLSLTHSGINTETGLYGLCLYVLYVHLCLSAYCCVTCMGILRHLSLVFATVHASHMLL